MSKSRQILRARKSLISRCLGTIEVVPFAGFQNTEWRPTFPQQLATMRDEMSHKVAALHSGLLRPGP